MNLILYAKLIVDLQIYFVSPCIFLIYSNDYDGNVKISYSFTIHIDSTQAIYRGKGNQKKKNTKLPRF